MSDRNGALVAAVSVHPEDEIMLISDRGTLVRTPVEGISVIGRVTQGVRLIRLKSGEKLVGVERIAEADVRALQGNDEVADKRDAHAEHDANQQPSAHLGHPGNAPPDEPGHAGQGADGAEDANQAGDNGDADDDDT